MGKGETEMPTTVIRYAKTLLSTYPRRSTTYLPFNCSNKPNS
ncbi:hypothetical protein ACVPOR_09400 [Staphylococcus aureus]